MLAKNTLKSWAALTLLPVLAGIYFCSGSPVMAASCERLASVSLQNVKITSAAVLSRVLSCSSAAGATNTAANPVFASLPAFCRVAATLTPSSDSDIKIEVWLPVSRVERQVPGGWQWRLGRGHQLQRAGACRCGGYATVSTDTGHTGNGGSFALGHPEKMIDFAYRSEHEMTSRGQGACRSFLRTRPGNLYWNGCSTGGRQGLTEAQRYPPDYNGIVAGAPANNRTHIYAWSISVAQAAHKDEASYIPPTKFAMIHESVLEACDALDGLKDGLIGDPTRCHFDPKSLTCKGEDNPSCLTPAQVETQKNLLFGKESANRAGNLSWARAGKRNGMGNSCGSGTTLVCDRWFQIRYVQESGVGLSILQSGDRRRSR